MTIALSANTPRVSYTVAEGVTQTAFTVNFEFFDDADLNFYVDGTLKTLTTHYTVTGGDGSTGTINTTVGNSVTGISGGSTVVITRSIALERTTDFPSSGAFQVATLNTELDRFTAIAAEIADDNDRSIHLADDDSSVSMELPSKANRLGTVLGFNATTGAVEAGPTIANVNSLSAITANINTVAGISANVTTVAGIQANVTTVAGISSNVTTVAGKASEITALAASDVIADMALLATSDVIADMALLADSDVIADMNTLATSDIVSDLNTLATSDIVTDLNILATSDNVTNMATLGASGVVGNIATVAGVSSNVTTVAGISSNVTTVAGVSSNVTSVAGIASNVTTVANDIANVNTVASNISTIAQKASLDDATALAIALG